MLTSTIEQGRGIEGMPMSILLAEMAMPASILLKEMWMLTSTASKR